MKAGTLVGGRYRIEAELGHGSRGAVYRAVHVTLGQRVAIKVISIEHAASPELRQRFALEATAAAQLRSRHVVTVYDHGETAEGNPYIVLEYLEGETLEARLERERRLPLADTLRVASHVARALARAHAEGIVHRDLKPQNVFLVRSDDDEHGWLAKVLDFGIAPLERSARTPTTPVGARVSSLTFLAPEQVRGAGSVDHRADLYALGMCVYRMSSGALAFSHAPPGDLLVAICSQPLPSLRQAAPFLPAAMEAWFQRSCARAPLARFQSADEMIEALAVAAGPGAPLAKHESVPEGRLAAETLFGHTAPEELSGPAIEQGSRAALGTLVLSGAPAAPGRAPPPAARVDAREARPGPPVPESHGFPATPSIASQKRARLSRALPLLIGVLVGALAVAALVLGARRSEPTRTPDSKLGAGTGASSGSPASLPTPVVTREAPAAPTAPPVETSSGVDSSPSAAPAPAPSSAARPSESRAKPSAISPVSRRGRKTPAARAISDLGF